MIFYIILLFHFTGNNSNDSESDDEMGTDAAGWSRTFSYEERGPLPEFDPPRQPGQQQLLDGEKTELDFFQLFVTDETLT